ncbi:MAG TPA: hypothetical protein PKJ41_08625 [Bryobacteraceae bacterium]|nr:hypothetical protein [Bryobacteraceae bacterium]HPT25285.1 hypothetical protein [Bryobacteraceae bacterium]
MANGPFELIAARPRMAAWTGLLFMLPFWVMNLIVVKRMEPVFTWIRPGLHSSPQEYVLLAVVLLLIPMGAMWALIPSLSRGPDGKRKFHATNAAVAMGLVLFFVAVALGAEIYACEVMHAPYCD